MIGRFRKSYLGVFVGLVLSSYRVVESGDVALIGYYMDGSATASPPTGDAFSWVALNEIKAGEVLYFSDASYHGGVFVAENLLKLEVPEDIPAGTVSGVDAGNLPAGYSSLVDTAYSVPGSLTLTPSGTGDQLVIFQDENVADAAGFRGLSAINASSTGWGRTGTSATESDLYPGMTNGVNAVAVGPGVVRVTSLTMFAMWGQPGEAGLPRYSLFENGEGRFWRVEFKRRINGGLIYRPMKSSSLEQSSFVPMTGTELVTPVNDEWERVTIDEPYDEVDASTMFGVVEVELDR
ncbi:MAG: hypothetical protein ACON38_16855 [Akkermansiaceae bacterium]